ncbi:response regulator [Hydrogenimonas sp.]
MKLKALIVEDESIVALHMESVLTRLGCDVVGWAATAKEALALAETKECDLLLADIRLSDGEDGVETADAIRKICGCAILFITAFRDEETLRKVAEVPSEGYLSKPFREEDLEALVHLVAIRRKKSGDSHRMRRIDEVYTYCLDCDTLFQDGERVDLTRKEQRLLRSLLHNSGEYLAYEQLDQIVWGESPVDPNTRRQLVYRFKQKLPSFPLKLVKGFGYKLDV